jgi:hypothetical protein
MKGKLGHRKECKALELVEERVNQGRNVKSDSSHHKFSKGIYAGIILFSVLLKAS